MVSYFVNNKDPGNNFGIYHFICVIFILYSGLFANGENLSEGMEFGVYFFFAQTRACVFVSVEKYYHFGTNRILIIISRI